MSHGSLALSTDDFHVEMSETVDDVENHGDKLIEIQSVVLQEVEQGAVGMVFCHQPKLSTSTCVFVVCCNET